ncbi:hypothetical protein [Brunnivagina elsteri]|uniref:hypothetical protein n=1 Tax=Brunnivagina elsteri TaxID=1247191 RepID=UPI0013043532|nr:hypothetical protein [Calothrix elsteri]
MLGYAKPPPNLREIAIALYQPSGAIANFKLSTKSNQHTCDRGSDETSQQPTNH